MAGLTKAYSAILNAERRAFRSKTAVLELLDKLVDPITGEPNSPETAVEPFSTVGTIYRNWDYKRISNGTNGEERLSLSVAESDIATPTRLSRCDFRFNGIIYEALSRDRPIGEIDRIWKFVISPSG